MYELQQALFRCGEGQLFQENIARVAPYLKIERGSRCNDKFGGGGERGPYHLGFEMDGKGVVARSVVFRSVSVLGSTASHKGTLRL